MDSQNSLIQDALTEVTSAREKFPSPDHLTLAFAEEAGELVKAAMNVKQKGGSLSEVRKEAVQAIAMALRLVLEGDPTIGLLPSGTEGDERVDLSDCVLEQQVRFRNNKVGKFVTLRHPIDNPSYTYLVKCDGVYRGYTWNGKCLSDRSGEWDVVEIIAM